MDIKDKTMFLNILLKNKVKLDKMQKIPTDLIEKCSIIELIVDKDSNLNLPSLLSHAKLEELQELLDGLVSKSVNYTQLSLIFITKCNKLLFY